MESPLRRRLAFAAIVCALVALGAYLLGPVAHRNSPPANPTAARTGQPSTGQPSTGQSNTGRSNTVQRSTSPATTPVPTASSQLPDIYQWLPFTQSDLAAAANTAVRFGDAYGTYSYTQSPAAYGATLQPFCSRSLVQQVEAAYATPGVTSTRQSTRQVATGVATVESINAFGPTSLTFILQVSQRVTATTGGSQQTTSYSVTLTGNGTSWQVTSVDLATVGNS